MNSVEFMESFFAIGKVGGVVVPLNWRLVADELEFILKDSGVKTLIFDNDFAATVADLESRGDKTDINQWLHVLVEPRTTPVSPLQPPTTPTVPRRVS